MGNTNYEHLSRIKTAKSSAYWFSINVILKHDSWSVQFSANKYFFFFVNLVWKNYFIITLQITSVWCHLLLLCLPCMPRLKRGAPSNPAGGGGGGSHIPHPPQSPIVIHKAQLVKSCLPWLWLWHDPVVLFEHLISGSRLEGVWASPSSIQTQGVWASPSSIQTQGVFQIKSIEYYRIQNTYRIHRLVTNP